jgi:hypothetical protein
MVEPLDAWDAPGCLLGSFDLATSVLSQPFAGERLLQIVDSGREMTLPMSKGP